MAKKLLQTPAVPEIAGLNLTDAQRQSKSLQTPFMRQWFAAKERYPDALIFFRMGDFYELFLSDAVIASDVLGLTLTARNKGETDEVPMAGAPHHQSHVYVAKALAAGYSVAICEQMADPSKCKGIVPRDVVRVITPGLVVDENALESNANHWLAALDSGAPNQVFFGLAALDLSTGEMLCCEVETTASLLAELAKLGAREVLVSESVSELLPSLKQVAPGAIHRIDHRQAGDEVWLASLADALGGSEAADLAHSTRIALRRAAGRALSYAQQNTPSAHVTPTRVVVYDPVDSMGLDEATIAHLELVFAAHGGTSLLSIIDETCTSFGARMLRRWLLAPLADVGAIRRRHDAVELFFSDAVLRAQLRKELKTMCDLERIATRASLAHVSPRELGALRDSLQQLPTIAALLTDGVRTSPLGVSIDLAPPSADEHRALANLLTTALVDAPPPLAKDGGMIREGYDADLDSLAKLRRDGDAMLAELESKLRAESGLTNLKIKFNRVFGWYLEVSRGQVDRVPSRWIRKQTIANGERYTTDELTALQDQLLSCEERYSERENGLFDDLCKQVGHRVGKLSDLALRLATLDVLCAFAEVAHQRDYVRPEIDHSLEIDLRESRHPVVEASVAKGNFVSNDIVVSSEHGAERLLLLTGPNMAGKSTILRQTGLCCILAQMGSFVPARSAKIGIVDRVMSRVGASDALSRGDSTFMVEMRETARILRQATRKSLLIIDEIGRGTSTYDGLAIAWAVAEHLHDHIGARTLFATHYHELCELPKTCPQVANYSVSARELADDILFLHRLVSGGASRSFGVSVAKLAGVPEVVLVRARAILSLLERGAALPSGAPSTLRGRQSSGAVQLDIFGVPTIPQGPQGAPKKPPQLHPVVATLREVDPDKLSPIEAWQLICRLSLLSKSEKESTP